MRVTRILQCLIAAMVVLSMGIGFAAPAKKKPRILCLMVTAGFRHTEAIDTSKKVLPEIAKSSGAFEIDITEKTDRFTKEGLAKYDAVFSATRPAISRSSRSTRPAGQRLSTSSKAVARLSVPTRRPTLTRTGSRTGK